MKLFDFVDEAFYINLDHRIDKRDSLVKQFKKFGINKFIKRFRGIYPYELGYKLEKCLNTNASHRTIYAYPHEGYAKGCTYSQIAIIKYAKQKNLKNILYFEDDAKFYLRGGYDPIKIINKAIEGIKNIPNWEILYLGTSSGGKDEYLDMVAPNLVKISESTANHAVLINCTIFDSILDKAKEHDFNHLDAHLSSAFKEKYMVYPACVIQRSGIDNDIGQIKYKGLDENFWLDSYNKKIRILYENK